jgi:CubicO group peptidase (beta-lactamase class C family)
VSRGAVGAKSVDPGAGPVGEQTVFDLASLTKPLVTATLLVLLEREGTLDLDAPLGSVLGELDGTGLATCRLRELATHTAGLAAWAPLYLQASGLEGYVAEIRRRHPSLSEAGTLYSDLGYVLLGAVLERVSGRDLAALFDERIARPLGLTRTAFGVTGHEITDVAATERGNRYERELAGEEGAGHRWRGEIPAGQVHDANTHGLGGVAGHAGLFGSAIDVARMATELLCPRVLPLDARARERLLRADPASEGRTIGLVVGAHASAARGILPDDAPGHTGFTGTSLWLDPARERCYVLLTNRVHPRVPQRSFQPFRRAFHRIAKTLFD